jgi:long-subunit fatty acid transport protein
MGGAFVAVADDATATVANPAGLLLISRSEISLEARHTRVETPFLERGRLSGAITNEGTDTIAGPVFGMSEGRDSGIAFLSGVYVPGGARRWRLAAYRHELVRVDQSILANGYFQKDPQEFTSRRNLPQQGDRTLNVTGYGGTAAYQLRPELSVGAGLTVYDFSIDAVFRRFDTVGFLGPPNTNVVLGRSEQHGDDTAVAPIVGAVFGTTDRAPVRVGVMFRKGASFDYRTKSGLDPERTNRFRVPHTLSVGASVQPVKSADGLPVLTLATEVTRVTYSRLREDFVVDQTVGLGRAQDFFLDNGTELHFGAQYWPTLSHGAPQFRGGVWYDPDHSVKFEAHRPPPSPTDRLFDEAMLVALGTGKTLVHYTGGVGFSLTSRFEVNAAVDLSSRSKIFSASVVVR